MTAFGAVSDDVNAILYNPAGLAQVSQREMAASYLKYFTDTNAGFVGGVLPQEGLGVFGLGVTYLSVADIERRSDDETKGSSFGSTDLAVAMAYGWQAWERISVGVSVKYVGETLDDKSANGFAADLGIMAAWEEYKAGLAVQNLGTGLKLSNNTDPFPLSVKLSGSWHPATGLVLGADADFLVSDQKNTFALGGEYWLTPVLAGRVGYKLGGDLGALAGFSGGIGLRVSMYQLDYAAGSAGDLGLLHRISLGVRF